MHSSSVVVSALVHTGALAALVIVPLLASVDLPDVHARSAPYVRVHLPPSAPAPPAPAPARPARVSPLRAAPIEAPRGIAPEPPIVQAGDGVIGGLEPSSETGLPFEPGSGVALPPPPPPPPAAPVPVGGDVRPPRRVAYMTPEYPPLARAARVEGDVLLEATIGVDGTVQDVRVLRAAPLLETAAIDALRRWRYTPTLLNGTPVPVVMTVTVSFRLR